MNAQKSSGSSAPAPRDGTAILARRAARKRHGFSLMELMIVVVITSVLAAIAIPTFTGYIQKSRTSEAIDFLGVIKLRQEAYRSEFGSYLICGGITDPTAIPAAQFVPGNATAMKNAKTVAFGSGNDPACFTTLGAQPGAPVRFGYAWAAGLPANAASLPSVYGLGASTYDHYFIAQAVTDLDGDGIACTYELTSFTRNAWFTPETGWE